MRTWGLKKVLILPCIGILAAACFLLHGCRGILDTDKPAVIEYPAAASTNHSAWIKDGKVYLAGEEIPGQDEMTQWENIVQVALSDEHILGLDKNGTVHAAGLNTNTQCEIDGLEDVVWVAAGLRCSAAVKKNGSVAVYGVMNEEWQKSLREDQFVRQIAIGDHTMFVLHADGKVTAYAEEPKEDLGEVEWKDIDPSACSDWKNVKSIAAAGTYGIGVTSSGKVLTAGKVPFNEEELSNLKDVACAAAGYDFAAVVTKKGDVVICGENRQGQYDANSFENIKAVAAGYDHVIAVDKQGNAYAAGYNGNGQCNVNNR